jgi:hypothetical protein
MDALQTIMRGDRRKNPEKVFYRVLSFDECKALTGHSYILDKHGHIARVNITSVKTWKTRPDVEIHCKFGMYEFFTIRLDASNPVNTELVEIVDTPTEEPTEEPNPCEIESCPMCGGAGFSLGVLGMLTFYRCEACGWQFSA